MGTATETPNKTIKKERFSSYQAKRSQIKVQSLTSFQKSKVANVYNAALPNMPLTPAFNQRKVAIMLQAAASSGETTLSLSRSKRVVKSRQFTSSHECSPLIQVGAELPASLKRGILLAAPAQS